MDQPSQILLQALAVTVALIGSEMSEATARALVSELSAYPEPAVLAALARCKLECKYRLSLADVIERMVDGHPGAEEAWEIVPKSERDTAVVTQEIMAAIPFDLIDAGDMTAARMAFRESYNRNVAQARAERRKPVWFPSLGSDKRMREAPLARAVQLGRMSLEQANGLLPAPIAAPGAGVQISNVARWPVKQKRVAL